MSADTSLSDGLASAHVIPGYEWDIPLFELFWEWDREWDMESGIWHLSFRAGRYLRVGFLDAADFSTWSSHLQTVKSVCIRVGEYTFLLRMSLRSLLTSHMRPHWDQHAQGSNLVQAAQVFA